MSEPAIKTSTCTYCGGTISYNAEVRGKLKQRGHTVYVDTPVIHRECKLLQQALENETANGRGPFIRPSKDGTAVDVFI